MFNTRMRLQEFGGCLQTVLVEPDGSVLRRHSGQMHAVQSAQRHQMAVSVLQFQQVVQYKMWRIRVWIRRRNDHRICGKWCIYLIILCMGVTLYRWTQQRIQHMCRIRKCLGPKFIRLFLGGEIIKSGKKIILYNYFSSSCFYKGRFAVDVNRITLVIIEQSFTSDFAYQL